MTDIETKLKDIPDKYLIIIAQLLAGQINVSDTFDTMAGQINRPILKASVRNIYWLFIVQYGVLAILGIFTNVAIIVYTMYHKLYKDITHAFIVNLALCHFVQCAIVLPITLAVMLIQNWIFGQFLCFFLPMLQDIPLHVAMISHFLIAWDRMRWLGDPLRARLPAFVCCCASWLTGIVIALPYPIYIIHLELGDYVSKLSGVGLCFVNLVDDMHEYMRGLFVIMYCGPAILLTYVYIRTAQELRPLDGPLTVMMYENRADKRNGRRNSSTSYTNRQGQLRSYDLYNAELDVTREKRTQRNLGGMAAVQIFCLCPLMILRLARMVVVETYENSNHFDLTYLMFVWIAFLPTVIFPCIYASEILPRTEKERLRGYFRLSSKCLKKSQNSQEESNERQENTCDETDNTKNEEEKIINQTQNIEINSGKKKIDGNNYTHPLAIRKISESINNSCSNITSSTYCNNGIENLEKVSILSVENDSSFEIKWTNSEVMRENDLFRTDCDTEGKSSVENMFETSPAGIERRKLPNIDKLCKSPQFDVVNNSFECAPFTQYTHNKRLTRKSSRTSSGRIKRNKPNSTNDEIIGIGVDIGAGVFTDRDSTSKMFMMENKMKKYAENNVSSTRSSIKSKDYASQHNDLDFRENIFADL